MRFVRRAFKIMGGVSGIGAVVAFSFRLLQVPEAITLLIPILETIWPILALGIGCGSLIISGTYVSRAIEYAEVFRRYGYLRGRIEIRKIIAKSKQSP